MWRRLSWFLILKSLYLVVLWQALIEDIVATAQRAPSSFNSQPYKVNESENFKMNLGEKSTLRWSWCGNLSRSWRSPRRCWPTLTSGLENMIQVQQEHQQIESTPMLPQPGGPGGRHHGSFLSRPAHGGRRLQSPAVLARHLQRPRRLHWQAHSQGTQSECQLQEIICIFAFRCNQQATQGGLPPSGGSPPSSSSQSSASSRWASQLIWELGWFWNAYYYHYVKYCPL